jgi:multidrug transporter EmrE-like cation transporter
MLHSQALFWIALVAGLLFTAAGQVFFKHYYTSRRRLDLLAAVALFGLVPVVNFLALRGIAFGLVYMSTAVTQVLVLFMCWAFLGEKLRRQTLPGVVLILAGIIVYAL